MRRASRPPGPGRLHFGVLLVAMTAVALPAAADHLDSHAGAKEFHDACQGELLKYCRSETLTVQPQINCLHEYYLNLSLTCRAAIKHRAATAPARS